MTVGPARLANMLLWGMFTGSRFGLAAISLRVKEQHILCATCDIATVQHALKESRNMHHAPRNMQRRRRISA